MPQNVSLPELLYNIRNQYSPAFKQQKKDLLQQINLHDLKSLREFETYYNCLLFILAYPDDKALYLLANQCLQKLEEHIKASEKLQATLYSTGITATTVCVDFGFEMTKWLRQAYGNDVALNSIVADDGQITYILSVVMNKAESEILQDCNDDWKSWLNKFKNKDEDLLDAIIGIFEQTEVRPEVKDELWNALGLYVTVNLLAHCVLPFTLFKPVYHKQLVKKVSYPPPPKENVTPVKIKLTKEEAEKIIDCGRMILARHIREIDPISFTHPEHVSYYQMAGGITIALVGSKPERRHPIDSYMGYIAFKNGLPISYAASWILFDSGRISLNIFPSYRGGESMFVFQQILLLHQKVYRLKRFSVDPYQIGKDNSDGIKSGSFWVYHHMGFRPIKSEQKKIAEEEAIKREATKGYRSPASVLKKLADSRMELHLSGKAVEFDATDLSRAYASIVKHKFNSNRKEALQHSYHRLIKLLKLEKAYQDESLAYVLKNWCVLLITAEKEIEKNKTLQKNLRELFDLKAHGSEEQFMSKLNAIKELRVILEGAVKAI